MSLNMQAAFEDALDRVQRGEATLEQVLSDDPVMANELRELLVVALDLQAMTLPPMTSAEMARGMALVDRELQRRLARPADEQQPPWRRLVPQIPRFMPARMAGVVAAIAVAIIAYGGVTLAAVNSGPDSALYGYRLSLEEFRISLASEADRATLYLENAEARLRDIEQTASGGDVGAVRTASDAYQDSLRKGVSALSIASAGAGPDDQEAVAVSVAAFRTRLRDHRTRFEDLTSATEAEVLKPISVARALADEGILDAERGPNLAVLPTAVPEPVFVAAALFTPTPTSTQEPLLPTETAISPPDRPAPTPLPKPVEVAVKDPGSTGETSTPEVTEAPSTPEVTEAPSTPENVVLINTETVLVGQLESKEDSLLVISGIVVRLPDVGDPLGKVDQNLAVGDWVQVIALVDADGEFRLRTLTFAPHAITADSSLTPETTLEAGRSPIEEATPSPEGGETAVEDTPASEPTPVLALDDEAEPDETSTPEAMPSLTPDADETSEPSPTPETPPTLEATQTPTPGGPAASAESEAGTVAPAPSEDASPDSSPTPSAEVAPGGLLPSPGSTGTSEIADTPSPTPTAEPVPELSPTDDDEDPVAEDAPAASSTATAEFDPEPVPTPGTDAGGEVSSESTPARDLPAATPTATLTPSPSPDGEADADLTASPTPELSATPTAADADSQSMPTEVPTPTADPIETGGSMPTPTPEDEDSEAPSGRLPTFVGLFQGVEEGALVISGIRFVLPEAPVFVLPEGLALGSPVLLTFRTEQTDTAGSILEAFSVELFSGGAQDTA